MEQQRVAGLGTLLFSAALRKALATAALASPSSSVGPDRGARAGIGGAAAAAAVAGLNGSCTAEMSCAAAAREQSASRRVMSLLAYRGAPAAATTLIKNCSVPAYFTLHQARLAK